MIGTKLSYDEAGYLPSQGVPFRCDTCVFFIPFSQGLRSPGHPMGGVRPFGTCHVVSGPIDPMGCCNVWRKPGLFIHYRWLSGSEALARIRTLVVSRPAVKQGPPP